MPHWDLNTNPPMQSEHEMGSSGVGRPEGRLEVILLYLNTLKFFRVVSFQFPTMYIYNCSFLVQIIVMPY
jgi:hypothetical protein